MSPSRLAPLVSLVRRLVRRSSEDEVGLRSSALAFSTLLSLVPLMAVMSVFVARTLREDDGRMVDLVADLLPYREEAVLAALRSFTDQAASVSGISILGFLFVTLLTFFGVQESLFKIFRVERPPSLARRLVTFSLLFLWGPLLVGTAQAGLVLFAQWSAPFAVLLRESFLLRLVPPVLTLPALALFYWRAALGRIRLGHAAIGALAATLALEGLKLAFAYYVSELTEIQRAVYGTFAIALFFVVSVQLAWLILLLGAEAAALASEARAREEPVRASLDDPWRTLVLLAAIADRDEPAERKTSAALAERVRIPPDEVDRLLAPLAGRGLLLPPLSPEGSYRLAVPPAELRLTRVLEAHPVGAGAAEAELDLAPLAGRLLGAARAELSGLTLADLVGAARARPEPPPLSDDTLSTLARERRARDTPDPFAEPAPSSEPSPEPSPEPSEMESEPVPAPGSAESDPTGRAT